MPRRAIALRSERFRYSYCKYAYLSRRSYPVVASNRSAVTRTAVRSPAASRYVRYARSKSKRFGGVRPSAVCSVWYWKLPKTIPENGEGGGGVLGGGCDGAGCGGVGCWAEAAGASVQATATAAQETWCLVMLQGPRSRYERPEIATGA